MTEVLFEQRAAMDGEIGVIVLNRPKVLNSLNQGMIQSIYAKLVAWSEDSTIKAVVIMAAPGRAFCAGGDLRALYEVKREHPENVNDFFCDEYRLNRYIYHFPKPYIALLDGITMGGGAGISIHGSHRIATENLIFAMPETGIGFYPDIGGTYFLSRLANYMGFYLGLTGNKINAYDCAHLGLATHVMASQEIERFLQMLCSVPLTDNAHQAVNKLLTGFSAPKGVSELDVHQEIIARCFSMPTVEAICLALEQGNEFAQATRKLLATKSATSLKVTLAALQKTSRLSFDACMQQDQVLTKNFLERHDFFEGIRALIIDKDQKPQWQPAELEQVTSDYVLSFFEDEKRPRYGTA